MPLPTPSGLAAVMANGNYTAAAKLTLALPVVGTLDLSANLVSVDYTESDTSSYPDDLTSKSGIMNLSGSVVVSGTTVISGAIVSMIRLFNPNDSTSPIYQQKVTDSPMTLSLGAYVNGSPEYVDRPVYLTTTETAVADGTVTLDFSDVPPGWDQLPAITTVVVAPPYNAGLNNEYVIDRIARIASNGAISSWPAVRNNCRLAVGLRNSLWPEVGTLLGALAQPSPSFAEGPYGSGLTSLSPSAGGYTNPQYSLSSGIGGTTVFIEYFLSNLTDTNPLNGVNLFSSVGGSFNSIYFTATTSGVSLSVNNGTPFTFSTSINTATHYVAAQVTVPAVGGTSASVTLWFDGASSSGTATLASARDTGALDTANLVLGSGIYAGVQVTTESVPTPNNNFVPLLSCDQSLNTLQAVPPIDKGSDAYTELQTVAESEGGYLGFRSGVLTFLNRNTVAGQSPFRSVTALTSFMGLDSAQTGAFQTFNDIEIDWSEWTFEHDSSGNIASSVVYTPTKVLSIPARSTQTWTWVLPNSISVAKVDGSISYISADTATPGATQSGLRASRDANGVNEINDPSLITGTVTAVYSSEIRVSVTNASGERIYLASPSNYTNVAAGTPALWINGVTVTQNTTSTMHINDQFVPVTSSYTCPTNQYRQDATSTANFGQFLLSQLWSPKVLYQNVAVVPSFDITAADRITLDIPLEGGATTPIDVYVWGVTFSASFDQSPPSWDMTLDVRAVAAPGAWILGQGVLGSSTYIY